MNIISYRSIPNSVEGIPFQLSQSLSQQSVPFHQQVDADYMRTLIERDSRCTLKQLCDAVREERGIMMSTTAMCRLVKGYNLPRRRSHRSPINPSRSLILAV